MNTFKLMLSAIALYTLTGCNTYKIALTDNIWDNYEPYAVEGRQQTVFQKKPLRFAEFYTTQVKTSARKSSKQIEDLNGFITGRYNNIAGVLYEQSESSRRFTMSNNKGQQAKVITFNKLRASTYLIGKSVELNFDFLMRSLGLDRNKTENSYYVQVFEPNQSKPWELMLDYDAIEVNHKEYAGYFALDDDHYYTIKPVNRLKGKNGLSPIPVGYIGYEINNAGGHSVAAVSLLNKTSVYLADDMEAGERFLMANLCAALLLYEPGSNFDTGVNN